MAQRVRVDLSRFLQSGWQSWSGHTPQIFGIPPCNVPPKDSTVFFSPKYVSITHKKPVTGWCSWYTYGESITERRILRQAQWMKRFNDRLQPKHRCLETVLIDDGWCRWGDWLNEHSKKFPHGLHFLSKTIRELGLRPGIWISPFLVDPNATIVQTHPEWIVRQNGRPVDGLRLLPFGHYLPWKKYILDVTQRECLEYIHSVVRHLLTTCRFSLIKLDFLYGIYAHPAFSTQQADLFLRSFLQTFKKRYPHVYTIACGCPLLPALGVVDSMRIGPDSTLDPFLPFKLPDYISSYYRNHIVLPTLENRVWTQKFWNVDLDVFLCKAYNAMTEAEQIRIFQLFTTSQGNMFLGEDLTTLTKREIQECVLPLLEKKLPYNKRK